MALRPTRRWAVKPHAAAGAGESASAAAAASRKDSRRAVAATEGARNLPEAHRERDGLAVAQDDGPESGLVLQARPEGDEGGHAVDGGVVDLRQHVAGAEAGVGQEASLRHAREGEARHAARVEGGHEGGLGADAGSILAQATLHAAAP